MPSVSDDNARPQRECNSLNLGSKHCGGGTTREPTADEGGETV